MASSTGEDANASGVARYLVQSSDVIADMRVNVFEEGTDNIIWYKERFLADDEIVEHVIESATSTVHWTIHRPKRGWYIRIRSPSFPPGVFISLIPLPQSSLYHTDTALTFACRTSSSPSRCVLHNAVASSSKVSIDSDVTLTDGQRESIVHSYPPTPPQIASPIVHPLSPSLVEAKLNQLPQSLRPRPASQFVAGNVTHFLLTPHSAPHVPHPTENTSIFTRLTSALKNHAPSHSTSFTISPISPPSVPTSPELCHTPTLPTPIPVLTFHDRTPVFTVRSTTGVIELDSVYVQSLGVETSFYIACALTYLEFLSEREGYLAAATD